MIHDVVLVNRQLAYVKTSPINKYMEHITIHHIFIIYMDKMQVILLTVPTLYLLRNVFNSIDRVK